ncbi:MAG TPA: UTP--glucose-1-phosphate uridylyltransferase [Pirellulales bacterium]|jgi:UDP-N-acetylglucosamine/UDP-N-acetylgalactosamine diphosphorylase|nr:UTP--glucose-1-phosphate uridylyltransferase [Pirellulales bacterium]
MQPSLEEHLRYYDQHHLLTFWNELSPDERKMLAEQIRGIDFAELSRLFAGQEAATDWAALARRAEPPPAFRLPEHGEQSEFSPDEARMRGEAAFAAGEVGAILVAGGQGTRLGWSHPKGTYPIGPVSKAPLFQILFERLAAHGRRYGTRLPLYLMTSLATHQETVAYLDEHQRFGVVADDLRIFCQGQMPAVEASTGRVLLESAGRIALSPDGHGGMLAALATSGGLQDMQCRGLRHLFYFQVDNPLVPIGDPEFLGYHLLSGSEMSTLVVAKQRPKEKLGVLAAIDGQVRIIEYSDMPDDVAHERDASGGLRFWAGNTGVHFFEREFLERVQHSAAGLPMHLARKKVSCVAVDRDTSPGTRVEPDAPNAIKFERFVFDLLPEARHAIVVESDAARTFAPVKNGPGEPTDSPEAAQAAMIRLHTEWLRAAGAEVAPDVPVEISPLFALDAAELADKIRPGLRLTEPKYFC